MSIWIETKLKESDIGKIPVDWSCTSLNKIADINPKPIKLDSDDIEVSFVGMTDVSESAKLMNTTNRLYGEVKKGFTSFQDNDVLVAKITPCFENGKGALISNLTNGTGFGSTEFHVIRAKEQKGCPEFIHHITTTHNFRVKGEMNMTGTAGQKRVGKDFIASYLIACPPFVEQQKIAEVLSTVDKKIDLIDQKIAETENLKTGLMQKLFSEGVGVQDENGEWQPHAEFQDSPFGKVPKCWLKVSLENIASVERGKFSARPRNDPKYFDGNIPFVQTGDVVNSQLYVESYSQTLNELGLTVSKTFPPETILITIAANIGDVAITQFPLACPDSLVGIQAKKDICNSLWLFFFMQTQKSELDSKATKSAQKNINLQVLKPLTVFLPSLEEQEIIAEILLASEKKIALLKQQKAETQQLKKGLMQKLLTGEWRVHVEETEAA
ncbi:restriction endonuclease subunit S [Vibrio parahaemolyticus]|uniref:restriction endonuclease subunit S n=1 Tax=Vibrio parahaemolyticus TaxID=670 RepID=UPI000C1CC70C|nr:restriction endonuclease subunit S [Vibrio parahaemolyticus]EGQ7824177.1 restriction endonuclease subunit S [Vibrio parahaemolyticus]EGR0908254.1 restriction endonuclease subunit S [Vibrio parahaemolyticus]EGV3808865.1 restriction endonuclease subunit S [Vibrio parahaemolyticus]EIA1768460.1 restriction endonuclease subunit S [Vibrio parahaemolyticus]EIR4240861.1 restriction endonuclease subunit S [Vibrio parahaemolyticus]